VEAPANQFGECDAAVLGDRDETGMDFAFLVFGAYIEGRSHFR
jgi:hypothetical protein